MRIHETAAMAVAYSASCGIALVDDASLSAVCRPTLNTLEELNSARRDVETGGEDRMPAVISPQELQESALVRNLIRLADGRRLFPGRLADGGRFSSSSVPGITAWDDSRGRYEGRGTQLLYSVDFITQQSKSGNSKK